MMAERWWQKASQRSSYFSTQCEVTWKILAEVSSRVQTYYYSDQFLRDRKISVKFTLTINYDNFVNSLTFKIKQQTLQLYKCYTKSEVTHFFLQYLRFNTFFEGNLYEIIVSILFTTFLLSQRWLPLITILFQGYLSFRLRINSLQ